MNKRIKKQFWLTESQDKKLKRICKITGLTEVAVIRMLLSDLEPKERPDSRFYEVMREVYAIGHNLNQLTAKAHSLGFIDAKILQNEMQKWNEFMLKIEHHFLKPDKVNHERSLMLNDKHKEKSRSNSG